MRKITNESRDAQQAMIALAGWRVISQTSVNAAPGTNTAYTVADDRTKRVVVLHLAAGNTDIRFAFNTAASSASLPLLPARYIVVDAGKGNTLNFWNTTAAAITVFLVEVA